MHHRLWVEWTCARVSSLCTLWSGSWDPGKTIHWKYDLELYQNCNAWADPSSCHNWNAITTLNAEVLCSADCIELVRIVSLTLWNTTLTRTYFWIIVVKRSYTKWLRRCEKLISRSRTEFLSGFRPSVMIRSNVRDLTNWKWSSKDRMFAVSLDGCSVLFIQVFEIGRRGYE